MRRILGTVALLVCFSSVAMAQIQKNGPEEFPGKNEFAAHLGYQQGLNTGYFGGGSASGFKLLLVRRTNNCCSNRSRLKRCKS